LPNNLTQQAKYLGQPLGVFLFVAWTLTEREFTTWCEFEQDGVLLWLEWNERVFAYRCGVVRHGQAGYPRLGFAESLEAAQNIALVLLG
jgi:hypothetical protein